MHLKIKYEYDHRLYPPDEIAFRHCSLKRAFDNSSGREVLMIPEHIKPLLQYAKNPSQILANIRRWKSPQVDQFPFIFVLGPPRSGTTLLHRILLNHSKIVGFSEETGSFSPRSVYDYERFKHFLNKDAHTKALATTSSMAGFFSEFHKLSLDLPAGGRFVEKTPQHAIYLSYLMSRFPQAQFIFALRDPRDTFCSGFSAGNIPQARHVEKHARYFQSCVAPLIALHDMYHSRVCMVKYEDFTRTPRGEVGRIMKFLKLSGEEDFQLSRRAVSSDDRAHKAEFQRLARPITPATVGRWKTEMSKKQVSVYQKIAGDSLSYFGYELA
ncbi:sulfotransferase family protein [Acidimangrovimonas sediminis]|uniref:sulfotransferase family protein n=1 Tax=Acidimangrovimonas sediminis TaxID=2056283 RepID=UPI0013048373|nr:sulfotransferase [Acidimangrovimonas sediminis]